MGSQESSASFPTQAQIEAARRTIEIYKKRDPVALQAFNRFQKRLLRAVCDPPPKPETLTVVLALKPNRVGGSFALMNMLAAIIYGSEHPLLARAPFGKNWPFLKSFRLFSTSENLGDVSALQLGLAAAFPRGRYTQSRGVGKAYNSAFTADNGWTGDMFSFGQDALAAAGANKGVILVSEPPPRDLFVEGITRLSGNGLMIIECTQLDLAPWLEEMADEAGGSTRDGVQYGKLRLDGKDVGEVRIVRGDVEDACREHSGGHLAHTAIEAMVAAWPAEEREARRSGRSMSLSGRIYPDWGNANELPEFLQYHQECLDKGRVRVVSVVDPHDRKPWACTWWATFPNEDAVAVAEWPPFDFEACKSSPVAQIEAYRDVLLEVEAIIQRQIEERIIDGEFGAAIKSGKGKNIIQMLAEACDACVARFGEARAAGECPHRMSYKRAPAYDGSIRDGHILVRQHIGGHGARPKLYALAPYTPNFCRGMRRYSWKENSREDRGLSEKPQLVHKDFPDNARMLLLSKAHLWPAEATPPKMYKRVGR